MSLCKFSTFYGLRVQVISNIFYYDVDRHYHDDKPNACNKGCRRDVTHIVTRRVATAWRARRARLMVFESPVTNETDTLEVRRVSIITITAKTYVSVSDVAVRVEDS
jgi:hypothetical protein